ncbi:MAG: DUF4397 domain-containing protein [Caldimonas sp.]
MRNINIRAGLVAVLATALLAACGGGGSSNGSASVRLVNATSTHPSLTLLANTSASVGATAIDTVSAYSGVDAGSPTLQLNDATSGTALATTVPSLAKDAHYTVLAYESGGAVKTAVIAEDTAAPTAGTAVLRVFDAATDSGAIDVYVTDPAVDITTLSSPTFTFVSSSSTQASVFLSFAPGTYRVRVTGAGNTADLRLDIASITLASQQLATVVLTPTIGGTLANGSVLLQQGAYTASRNTNARVRLFAAVTPGALVSASAGAPIAVGNTAPSVSAYALVPAGSALAITVNGAPVTAPATTLAAGVDATLLVYGSAASPTASLLTDDNHLPTAAGNLKMRMINGLTGAASPLTLQADFSLVASNIGPGTASSYSVVASSTSMQIDVASTSQTYVHDTALNVPGNAVYTLFMLGDASVVFPSTANHLLRRDR